MNYAQRTIGRNLWDLSVEMHRRGFYTIARVYAQLAGRLLGCDLAAPVSLALGGVR